MSNVAVRKFFFAELSMVLWSAYLILFGYAWYIYLIAVAGSVLAIVSYETSGKVGRSSVLLLATSALLMVGTRLFS